MTFYILFHYQEKSNSGYYLIAFYLNILLNMNIVRHYPVDNFIWENRLTTLSKAKRLLRQNKDKD